MTPTRPESGPVVSDGCWTLPLDAEQLLTRVAALIWPDVGDLTCEEPGHGGGGHTCLPVPSGTHLAALMDTLGSRYGDPVTEASDLPSLPDGERTSWVRAWPFGGRWIAYGRPPHGETARPVVTVTPRITPNPDHLPVEASWLDRLTAVTGWAPTRLPAVDWTAIESR